MKKSDGHFFLTFFFDFLNLNISLLEYIDILENFDKANINKVPKKILNNYKIFFSQDFDFESTNNYDFDDSDSDCNNNEDNDNEDNNDCNIKTHKMTDKEINFFNIVSYIFDIFSSIFIIYCNNNI